MGSCLLIDLHRLSAHESAYLMSHHESPKEHYDSSGFALVAIGSALMFAALIMMSVEYLDDDVESKHDHISNLLIAISTILTGFWLRSHDDEDLST